MLLIRNFKNPMQPANKQKRKFEASLSVISTLGAIVFQFEDDVIVESVV